MSAADGSPELPYPKLPFWHAVELSYSAYFSYFRDVLRTSWLWLIVTAGVTALATRNLTSWMVTAAARLPGHPSPVPSAGASLFMQFSNLLLVFAGASIAVAWHRRLLLGERPGISGGNTVSGNLWRYIAIGLMLMFVSMLPIVVVMVPMIYILAPTPVGTAIPSAGVALLFIIIVAIYAASVAVALRLSPLLPARAIGDAGLNFRQSWDRTRGNTWRLFWGIVVTTAPPLLLMQIAVSLLIGASIPAVANGEILALRFTIVAVVFGAYYLLIVPISIGFLSHAYRHFFQEPLVPPMAVEDSAVHAPM